MKINLALILMLLMTAFSCGGGVASTPPPQFETKTSTVRKITFYGDILPFLESNKKDANYKCTTCHAHYRSPASVTNITENQKIIKSMVNASMPRGGTPVSEEKIEMFRIWQNQGFPLGEP